MPFVFAIIGVVFLVAGVRGQSSTLFALIKSDFSGSPNYFEWMIAIFAVGVFGYIDKLSTISRMFMFLVMAGLLYQNYKSLGTFHAQETAPSSGTGTQPGVSSQVAQNAVNPLNAGANILATALQGNATGTNPNTTQFSTDNYLDEL